MAIVVHMRKANFIFIFIAYALYAEGMVQVPQSSLLEPQNSLQEKDEVKVIDSLMESTHQQLEVQKQMRQLMCDFRKQKEAFAKGNQTKAHASLMVRTARQVYESIQGHHLEYLFSQDYLDELLFFSSIAGKNRVKAP
ncbi:MAG TPA: hypothetical protein VGJ00_01310 [Rhabdochlamydiaceae bacterium]